MRFDKRALGVALAAVGALAGWPGCVAAVIAAGVLVAALAVSFWDKDQRPPETLRTAPET